MDSYKLHLVILAVLLSVVGPIQGAEREFLFPILTHVGNYRSRMVVMNPSKYSVSYHMKALSPSAGGSGVGGTLDPHSMSGFGANFDINPSDFRGGWGFVRYNFLGVPDADKERVERLRLVAWTELRLLEKEHPLVPVIAIASIPAVEAALEFRVPGVFRRDEEAAIAILNPSEEPIQIEVTLYYYRRPVRNSPYVQVKNTLSVPPMARISRFLGELMTEDPDNPLELPLSWTSSRITLSIRGSAPIAVGALLYNRGTGAYGNLPVVRVD